MLQIQIAPEQGDQFTFAQAGDQFQEEQMTGWGEALVLAASTVCQSRTYLI